MKWGDGSGGGIKGGGAASIWGSLGGTCSF